MLSKAYLLLLVICLLISQVSATEISASLTTTQLGTSSDNANSELLGILDVDLEGEFTTGRWHIYLEGTTSSKNGRVTQIYPEAYADAGAAADENGNGRLQISSLEYYYPFGEGELVVGLLYPSGFTESADWANDETSQFIGSAFINIQTVGSPDYALGIGYNTELKPNLKLSIMLSQAQGLGDLDTTYGDLFDNLDEYFFSAELSWRQGNLEWHTGLWATTLDTIRLDGNGRDKNVGAQFSVGYNTNLGLVLLRYGIANKHVSEAEQFIGVSWQAEFDKWSFGLGTSRTFASGELSSEARDSKQHEIYLRYQVHSRFYLTGAYQKITHSGFALADIQNTSPSIFALRASYNF